MDETLSYGKHGPKVRYLQELLNKSLTGPRLEVDGIFGPQTEAAVSRFQASIGYQIDGVVGPLTWVALKNRTATRHEVRPVKAAIPSEASWMPIATEEIGQTEISGDQNNPRIIQYHASTTLHAAADEIPWCSSFVNWCLREAGIKGTRSAAAASWLTWGKPSEAKIGAITIIHSIGAVHNRVSVTGYHVGFFLRGDGSSVTLLGGNQRDQVRQSTYPKKAWRVVAYRWPEPD